MVIKEKSGLVKSRENCDIQQFNRPTLEDFGRKCFVAKKPALLLNTFNHWPALRRWKDLNYILRIAGHRLMPIEIGTDYTSAKWTQQLMRLNEFLYRQFPANRDDTKSSPSIEYLAQYELFEHVPELRKDFMIPDYCSLCEEGTESDGEVDIKAWLGPKGTVTPLHQDPKHNLLCQIFGKKHIILASTEDSEFLYPHSSRLVSNTSQINVENLDYKRFPLAKHATFYHLTIETGDCLYIPPKWWHYVRAESPSLSVSFWWT